MRLWFKAGVIVAAFGLSIAAQDWYHDREERYRGEQPDEIEYRVLLKLPYVTRTQVRHLRHLSDTQ
jgi:hypothetical protein